MWSYRLYRYPSPSSSTLVYGISKPMNDNSIAESGTPQAVAQAVYRALISGLKLPPLNDSEELRSALLSFEVQTLPLESENSDILNGNKGESKNGENRTRRSSLEGYSTKAGPSKEDVPRKKSNAPSVLMLEAMSKRRMDAVRQLHEVCPQLLSSIPLFDHRSVDHGSSLELGSAVVNDQQCHSVSVPINSIRSTAVSHSASVSSSITLTANTCQMHCTSRLLDLAAENQTLLVFVLQHHPEVNKLQQQERLRIGAAGMNEAGARGKISKKCDAYNSIGSAHDMCHYHVDVPHAQATVLMPVTAMQNADECGKREGSEFLPKGCEHKEDDEKNDGDDEGLKSMDPNNPITICIRKNNMEVLQYLLFKHVWQHFLLDEIYNLPHSSIVTDVMMGQFIHASSDWFVHCSALMGCPRLLQILLSGHFGSHQATPETSVTANERKSCSQEEENGRSGMQTVLEVPELSDLPFDKKVEESSDSRKIPKESKIGKKLNSVGKVSGNAIWGASSTTPLQKANGSPMSPASPEVSMSTPPSTNPSTSSCQSLTSSKSKKKVLVSESLPESRRGSFSRRQSSLNIPDPNRMYSVSLPIMDRWISRCMHVRLTALHLACWRCDPSSIRVLLQQGADVNLLAEELIFPDTTHSTPGSQPTDSAASAQSSATELSLNFVSVTVNTSSMDLSAKSSSMEELLKKGGPEAQAAGLSPLAMLALGIRSPPDFSLSIGKSLGLVLPTLPELWGGQVDRSCVQARILLMDALTQLLDAGSDVNASALVFGKLYRVIELFLQPSLDLYYAPLMPRGGRDSAVLRCMDLERVAEIVLGTCWKLCLNGACLGPCFLSSMEWNLYRMDWMFLQKEALQKRFLLLAVFLGLFPPLDPELCMGSLAYQRGKAASLSGQESQSSVGHTVGGTDLRNSYLPPYSLPPRPSCIPWAPSMSSHVSGSPEFSPVESEEWETPPQGIAPDSQRPQDLEQIVTSYYSTVATQARPAEGISRVGGDDAGQALVVTPPVCLAHFDVRPASADFRSRSQSLSSPCLPTTAITNQQDTITGGCAGYGCEQNSTATSAGPSLVSRAQRVLWGLEERQRRCLQKFANDAVRLKTSPTCLALVLDFLCMSDLHLLARVTEHMLQTSNSATESPVQRLHDAVLRAQKRSLQHVCKLAILRAIRWRSPAVSKLLLPDSLKRYLLEPC